MPQTDVTQPDIEKCLQLARNDRHRLEEFKRILNRHTEDFGNVLALVVHFQRFAVVTLAVANIARHVHVRQKVHLDFNDAIALARFAAAALDVKRKAARAVAARARLGHRRKQIAYRRKQPGVGRRIRAWRAPNRRLINRNHFVEMV